MQKQMTGLVLAGAAILGCAAVHAQTTGVPGRIVPGQYIIMVKEGASADTVMARHGVGAAGFKYEKAVRGFSAQIPAAAVARLKQDLDVEAIIPDREVAAIGKPTSGGTTTTTSVWAPQVVPVGVQHIGAVSLPYTGAGVGVAVVDTGIDLTNQDLLVGGKSYSSVSKSAKDDNGHGTHVAGIVAALNNSIGVVGAAPQATVYAVKVLDRSGNGTDSSVMAGLDWVAANAALVTPRIKVVNMSLGRPGTLTDNPAYRAAVKKLTDQGITVVVAAGNDCGTEVAAQVPAGYPEVIAVGSVAAKDGLSQYPGFAGVTADSASYFTTDGALALAADGSGYVGVTISAPGEDEEDVGSTGTITSLGILSLKVGGGTTRMSGTSMAAPHTAGVAALLVQKYGSGLAPADVRGKIEAGAADVTFAPHNSPVTCYTFDGDREGILNAPGALSAP